MKMPSSSSLFLATLAISSSSSSLAAPTTDAPEGGMTSSTSSHQLASQRGEEVADVHHDRSMGKCFLFTGILSSPDGPFTVGDDLDARGLVDGLLNSVAGLIEPILPGAAAMVKEVAHLFPTDEKVKMAIANVNSALAAGVPGPSPSAASGLVARDDRVDVPSSSSDPTSTGTSDSLSPSATSTQTPPNTPVMRSVERRQVPALVQPPVGFPTTLTVPASPLPTTNVPPSAAGLPIESSTLPEGAPAIQPPSAQSPLPAGAQDTLTQPGQPEKTATPGTSQATSGSS